MLYVSLYAVSSRSFLFSVFILGRKDIFDRVSPVRQYTVELVCTRISIVLLYTTANVDNVDLVNLTRSMTAAIASYFRLLGVRPRSAENILLCLSHCRRTSRST